MDPGQAARLQPQPMAFPPLQKETLPSTRLAALPPAFGTRVLPAQATEYKFAFIQVPQDVSPDRVAGKGSSLGCPAAWEAWPWPLSTGSRQAC